MKRGQNINITTIIILILAILVLLLLVISFTGGWTALWKRITGQQEEAGALERESALRYCALYYTLNNKEAFCNEKRNIKGIGEVTCRELFEKGYQVEGINSTVAQKFCEGTEQ